MFKNNSEEYKLYVMGARGTRPVHGRDFEIFGGQTSCFIIKNRNHAVIIDCGTGLFDAEEILSDCDIIDVVFTHVHYDHILGLLDFSMFPKTARVSFIGTFRSWLSCDTLSDFYRHPFWPVQPNLGAICEITNDGSPYNLSDGMVLQAYKASHPDEGNVIVMTLGDKKVCFMFDMEVHSDFNMSIIRNCQFLVFDGMFEDDEYRDHIGWGHSTYQEGCRMAVVYECQELLITHHNPKNDDEKLLRFEENAKTMFPNTRFCRAGDIFVIE